MRISSMDAEWLKSFFEIGGVVLLFLTFMFGAGFMLTGKEVNEHQAERLRKFDIDLTGAKTELVKQEVRAATAEGNIALAEQHAKEADAKAEGFRLAIAKAGENAAKAQANLADANKRASEADAKAEGFRLDIAKAQEQAASANLIAEQERFARLQLEARLADRVVTPDQQRRIMEAFAPMKGETIDVVTVGDSPEISRTSNAILEGIRNAGVLFNFSHPFSGGGGQGIVVGIRVDASEEAKHAGTQLVTILRETLNGGVGLGDFEKMVFSGTGTFGSDKGAGPAGKSPIRLQISPK